MLCSLIFCPVPRTQKAPRSGSTSRCAVLFYGIWFGKGGIMLSRRRDLRRSLPVILSYQRISAKVLCIRESFMNPVGKLSGYILFGHEYGLRLPAYAAALERALHSAGRCPNSNSLFPPQAAVVAIAGHSIARPIACGNRVPPSGRSSENISGHLTFLIPVPSCSPPC